MKKRLAIAAATLSAISIALFVPISIEVSPGVDVVFVDFNGVPHSGVKVYRSWGAYHRTGLQWRITDDTGACHFPRESVGMSAAERLAAFLHSKLPLFFGSPLLNATGIQIPFDDKQYMPVQVQDCVGVPTNVSQVHNDGSLRLGIQGVGQDRCFRVIRKRT